MSVITYDKPVRDLIAQLNATGHVTHQAYRKSSVTFHHNAGRLSHQGVLDVWKTRPASTHFDVDGAGAVAQFVKINEYAWAAGNTQGNMSSIHIEMANATLAPEWRVADVTWKEAARLAGWLFARVIGTRPTKDNVFVHKHWYATACAGPYMDSVYAKLLAECQRWYDYFTKKPSTPAKPSPAKPKPAPAKKTVAQLAVEVIRGDWGNGPDRSRRLAAAGYNPAQVQAEVNARLGGRGSVRPSIALLATQVITGQWGNGTERVRRLTAAGYDAAAVQAEVNRRLR